LEFTAGSQGEWTGWQMCDEGTYLTGWAVKTYNGLKGVDHYGLGAIRIYCDAIGDERRMNQHLVQNNREDGRWIEPTYEGINSLQNHNIFCAASVSYDDENIGIDGLRVKKCEVKVLKYLTGEWANVISSYGTPALEYQIESVSYTREVSSSKYEELDKQVTQYAFGPQLDVYYFKLGFQYKVTDTMQRKVVSQFEQEFGNYMRTNYVARCKPADG